jgi:hypothetical protein
LREENGAIVEAAKHGLIGYARSSRQVNANSKAVRDGFVDFKAVLLNTPASIQASVVSTV